MVKSKCPKEVIFSGGNFGTISFLGCIQALIDSENFETKNVKRWVGTSGGAVISFLLAIGYNTKTIMKVLKEVPLSKISKLTSDKWLTFFDKYGLHNTNSFRRLFETMLSHKGFDVDLTFIEFHKRTNIELVFTSFCLNTESLVLLNHKNTPNLKILDALCMAIAVPFLFLPVSYQNRLYVDGFIVSNHPVDMCTCSGEESISFCLKKTADYYDKIDITTYMRILINSPLTKIQEVDLKGYKGKNYSILCNHKFGSSFDFSPSTIEGFYDCGYKTRMDEATEKSRREFNSSSDSESSDNESIYEVSFDIDT